MSPPKLIVMAKPPPTVRNAMLQALRDLGLEKRLGNAMFEPENWHQTLSSLYPDAPQYLDALARTCATVSAERFPFSLDRIVGSKIDKIHLAFRATRTPKGMSALKSAIRNNLRMSGLIDEAKNSPHVTISYRAPELLGTISITPIVWSIDEFLLVRNGGKPFHYEELGRWSLKAPAPSPQLSLF